MMTKLTNGIVVTSEIKSLILDYLNEALDFELRGELEKMHFPYESVKQFQEYKTFEEIETLARHALDYFLFLKTDITLGD